MYEFAYCFALNGMVQWSSETANSLRQRFKDDLEEQTLIEDFIEAAQPGSFITLPSGILVFCCSVSLIDTPPAEPKTLMQVMQSTGLLDD